MQSKTKSNIGISPLRRDNGHMAVSEAEKAGVLNNIFANVLRMKKLIICGILRWEKGQI